MLLRGGLVALCFRLFVFTVAPKAWPCAGYCYPLHHCETSLRGSALPYWGIHLWCSRPPFGRLLRHLRTDSGPFMPALPLSSAASRLPVSCVCVFGSAPPSLPPLPVLRWVPLCRCFGLLPSCWIRLVSRGATESIWSFAAPPSPSVFLFAFVLGCLLVFGCVLLGPLSLVVLGVFFREIRTRAGAMDWTALQRASLARPGLLSALQSRAPASSKVCIHGSLCADELFRQLEHAVGERHLVLLTLLTVRPLQHSLQVAQGRWCLGIFEQFCRAPDKVCVCVPRWQRAPDFCNSAWPFFSQINFWPYLHSSFICDLHIYTVCPSNWNMMVLAAADCGLSVPGSGILMLPLWFKVGQHCIPNPYLWGWDPNHGSHNMQLQEYNKSTASKADVYFWRTWLHHLRSMCGLQLLTMLSDLCSAFCELSDDDDTRYRWHGAVAGIAW